MGLYFFCQESAAHHRSVSGFAENCTMVGISSLFGPDSLRWIRGRGETRGARWSRIFFVRNPRFASLDSRRKGSARGQKTDFDCLLQKRRCVARVFPFVLSLPSMRKETSAAGRWPAALVSLWPLPAALSSSLHTGPSCPGRSRSSPASPPSRRGRAYSAPARRRPMWRCSGWPYT